MTTKEREDVRGHLLEAGFLKISARLGYDNPVFYDTTHKGNYREIWQNIKDNTIITVDWDYKSNE